MKRHFKKINGIWYVFVNGEEYASGLTIDVANLTANLYDLIKQPDTSFKNGVLPGYWGRHYMIDTPAWDHGWVDKPQNCMCEGLDKNKAYGISCTCSKCSVM